VVLLSELLDADRVKVPLNGRTKDEVLRELVELAAPRHAPEQVEAILGSVRDREREMTTGLGDGVAVPHGRTPFVDRLVVAAGVSRAPVEYDALDGNPVELFFLLVGPESAAGAHVKVLSRLARLLRREDIRRELRSTTDCAEFLRIVRASEES
jgi:mannitol/fructose-specific phosphotransferase system IIA component (Ntr-type)